MIKYRLRKDRLVSEENVKYTAYGIDAYEGLKRVKVIKDVSLKKKSLKQFVKQCKTMKLQNLEEAVLKFVESESDITEKPCFLK